jgi:HD-like signal output (HDOD) protein
MPGVNVTSVTAGSPLDCPISSPAYALLEQLSTHQQVAGLGVGVLRIVQLIDGAESALPELTRMMMAEPFIAQKLVSSANVALGRRGIPPITTVSKAILLLGMEQVRTLALSTLLVSKLGNKRQANRIQFEFATLIYASTLARELASEQGLCDPEEAAICALFRSIGRLIVALYLYQPYEEALAFASRERISESQAAVRVLGLSFERVGVEILRHWQLPERIVQGSSPCPEVVRASSIPQVRLQTLASFCVEVSLAVREPEMVARRQSIEALLQRYGTALRLERNALKTRLQITDAHANELSRALGLAQVPAAGDLFDELSTLTFSPLNRPKASLVLRAGLVTLNRMLSRNETCDAMLKRASDMVQRAFNFQRVAVYSTLRQSPGLSLRAVAGTPPYVNAGVQGLQGIEKESIVAQALSTEINLYIRSPSDDAIGQWAPWFSLFPDAKSFFLLPIISQGELLGLFYADYPRSNVQGWTSEELELVEAVKQLTWLALSRECTVGVSTDL